MNVFPLYIYLNFKYKKIAIDTSLYLYKFKSILEDNWMEGFINLIKCIRKNNVHCAFIFDGKAPTDKVEEQLKRREERKKLPENVEQLEKDFDTYLTTSILSEKLQDISKDKDDIKQSITSLYKKRKRQIVSVETEDFDLLKELFDCFSIPYFTAPTEAEKFCSKLCIEGTVDAVLSDDTDIIAYGCPISLSQIRRCYWFVYMC